MTDIDENAALGEVAKRLEAEGLAQSMARAAEETGSPFPPGVKMDPAVVQSPPACEKCGDTFDGAPNYIHPETPNDRGLWGCVRCAEKTKVVRMPIMSYPQWASQAGIPTPVADLRERIAICERAGVIRYRDAGLEITFDPEARKKPAGTLPPGTERTQF